MLALSMAGGTEGMAAEPSAAVDCAKLYGM
jgi:hypothetical protein